MVGRSSALPPLVLHVNPVGRQETDFHLWPVAALVLVADPAGGTRIDPAVAAAALGLTGMETIDDALSICDKLNRRLGYDREAWTAMAAASMHAEDDDPDNGAWH